MRPGRPSKIEGRPGAFPDRHGAVLAWFLGFRFLDAESHPQIQLADILAGTVRAITETGDDERGPSVAPYL